MVDDYKIERLSIMTNSTVTALVPAYQAASFIQASLDSLSAQTYKNLKVIISVDRSEDNTYEICRSFCESHPHCCVIKQNKRLGYVGNCNFLIDQAESDYALFAFHDDLLFPEYIEKLTKVLDHKPEAIAVYSDIFMTSVNGQQQSYKYEKIVGIRNRAMRGIKIITHDGYWWVPNRGVFRLKEARKINGLKKHLAGEFSADLPWLFHMSLLGEFERVPEILCHKYYRESSLSRTWQHSIWEKLAVDVACLRELWDSKLYFYEKFYVFSTFIINYLKLIVTKIVLRKRRHAIRER